MQLKPKFVTIGNYKEIREWYHKRNMEAPAFDFFPTIGYWVPGVAAGFLYATDTTVCLLDGYITNPEASSDDRHAAIAAITGELLEKSKIQGFQRVLVFSKEDSIIKRARILKFTDNGSYVMLDKEV